jgi:predicted dehydrogenase|tara:strand:- start:1286 stop:2341 length:1056 start_codon:yes stop_codon:yes gene_type:complete
MAEINFGVVGAGAISGSSCREISAHPRAKLVAACDLHAGRLHQLQSTFSIPTIYPTAEALIQDSAINAVYIAVPNVHHVPIALQALHAGKHVILDKPFALNLQQAREVADLAEQQDTVFMLGMNQRFVAGAQAIKTMVARGDLGEIYHGRAFWMRRSGIPRMGTWFGSKELAGGGSLLDIGVHLLDLALYILDNFEPVSVSGATYSKFGPRGLGEGGWGLSDREEIPFDVDDFATALIRLKGGVSVTLDVSWALHQRDSNLMNVNLFGTEAGATVYPAEVYRYGDHQGEYQLLQNPSVEPQYDHNSRFFNFINSILGEEQPCVTIEQALAVQSIIDAIYQSCQSGKEVRFN